MADIREMLMRSASPPSGRKRLAERRAARSKQEDASSPGSRTESPEPTIHAVVSSDLLGVGIAPAGLSAGRNHADPRIRPPTQASKTFVLSEALVVQGGMLPRPGRYGPNRDRTATVVLKNIGGVRIWKVRQSCAEACRFLTGLPLYQGPLFRKGVFEMWKDAILRERQNCVSAVGAESEGGRPSKVDGDLDGSASEMDSEADAETRTHSSSPEAAPERKKRNMQKDFPILTITVPITRGAEPTLRIRALNHIGVLGMEWSGANADWLVQYLATDVLLAAKPAKGKKRRR